MSALDKPQRPTGFWLKEADRRITERQRSAGSQGPDAHAVAGPQHSLRTRRCEEGRVFETMRTFVDEHGLNEILNQLIHRGWIAQQRADNGEELPLLLTERGQRSHATIIASQKEVRQQGMEGQRTRLRHGDPGIGAHG